ncbi:hypothetical protein [Pseudoxanthomonas sp. UTMC 1351]|uniref:hypothetical protein n=1 Tax=Pseudoxanthomonas sp. UTMC 1351 TaxID=2695853 RepID=UPI0034CD8CDB
MFIAMLVGCASVSHERVRPAGDNGVADAAPHPAIPSGSGRSRSVEAAPLEIIEAFPDDADPVLPQRWLIETQGCKENRE